MKAMLTSRVSFSKQHLLSLWIIDQVLLCPHNPIWQILFLFVLELEIGDKVGLCETQPLNFSKLTMVC